jgi:hypothetical protein
MMRTKQSRKFKDREVKVRYRKKKKLQQRLQPDCRALSKMRERKTPKREEDKISKQRELSKQNPAKDKWKNSNLQLGMQTNFMLQASHQVHN